MRSLSSRRRAEFDIATEEIPNTFCRSHGFLESRKGACTFPCPPYQVRSWQITNLVASQTFLNLYALGKQIELSRHSIGGKRSLLLQTNSLKSKNYIPCGPKLIEVIYMGILNKFLRSFARCCDHTPINKLAGTQVNVSK